MNIGVLLEMAADGLGDRVLVGSADGGHSGADVLQQSRAVAALLADRGAERLGLVGQNGDDVPALLFGSALAGCAYVPVSYRVADDRLRSMLGRLAPALVVVDDEIPGRVGDVPGVELITRDALADVLRDVPGGDGSPAATASADDAAVWLFTSGTTGDPKAAVLRHHHLSSYVLASVDYLGAAPDEAALVSVPPYHVAGVAAVLSGVYRGRRSVFLPSFDPEAWVGTARHERITHAMVVPTMLARILEVLGRDGGGLPDLQHLSYGGGRMPRPVIEAALAMLPNVAFVNAYGLTETSSTIAVLDSDEHREAFRSSDPDVAARLGSVGRPLPGVEVSIRDTAGNEVAPGDWGEVWVRGEQVAGEYVGQGSRMVDGWFPTRDGGRIDHAGYLYLEGRLDDVIVRGGENISPGEIEEVLIAHPAVAEAAVVGLPDVEWGERVVAAVARRPGVQVDAEELQAWVRDRLRSTRTPEHIEVRDDLPYNETGKLLRRVVREELAARFPVSAGG